MPMCGICKMVTGSQCLLFCVSIVLLLVSVGPQKVRFTGHYSSFVDLTLCLSQWILVNVLYKTLYLSSEDKFAVGSSARLISVCYFEKENDW